MTVLKAKRWSWIGFILLVVLFAGTVFLTVPGQAAPQTGLISGFVTDPAGALPPAGTIIRLITPDGTQHGQATVSPATGAFSLGPVLNGNYLLRAHPPAGSPFTPSLPYSLLVLNANVNVGPIALTNPDLTGTVYAPDGLTPASANLHIFQGGHQIQVSPAPNGDIQIGGLLSGTYRLLAEPVGNQPTWWSLPQFITVTTGIGQNINFTLRPANVAGIITDPQGVQVAEATVHLYGLTQNVHQQRLTNADGYFAIGDLPNDTYILRAEPPWWANSLIASEAITVTVPPDFTDVGQVALGDAPKILTGHVETNTGTPVQEALIIATRVNHPGRQEILTNSNGDYELGLGSGLWAVTVEPTDSSNPANWLYPHPPKMVYFNPNILPESKSLDFTVLTADSTVVGMVEMPDGSTPPFTVTVSLRNDEGLGRTVLLNGGAFEIHVPHGTYRLFVTPADPGYSGPPPVELYAPQSDTLDVGLLTLLARDAALTGTVVDSNGQGVGDVRLFGWTDDYLAAQTVTNPDGSYLLAVPAGTWQLRPEVPHDLPYIYVGNSLTATVTSLQTITDLNFTLTEANNSVVGQLVDENGQPVNSFGWAAAGNASGPVNGAPITNGTFTIYLPDGDYLVRANLPPASDWLAGPAQPLSISGGQSVQLAVPLLAQDATIHAGLWDVRQQTIPTGVEGYVLGYNGWAWVGDDLNPANGLAHLGVSAGLWHLTYGVDPQSGYVVLDHHKLVPLESGQSVTIGLAVAQRDSLLEGVVLDPAGNPLPGAVVTVNGFGGLVNQVTLRTMSGDDGSFQLAVPHGVYHLWAASDNPAWLNPAQGVVQAPAGGTLTGLTLQFREPDVTLSGTTSIVGNPPVNGLVHIWGYTSDGAASQTETVLGDSYHLDLLDGLEWHIGAALETEDSFYALQSNVAMNGNGVLNLVLNGPFPKPGPLTVTFDAMSDQSISLADGTHIFVPAGAMPTTGNVTLRITPIATFPHQHHARLYKYGYAIVATDQNGVAITANFNQNVIITFGYSEAELQALNLNEDGLRPAYFSTTTNSWTIPDSYVVDSGANRVIMQIDHFTNFSLLGSQSLYQINLPIVLP